MARATEHTRAERSKIVGLLLLVALGRGNSHVEMCARTIEEAVRENEEPGGATRGEGPPPPTMVLDGELEVRQRDSDE